MDTKLLEALYWKGIPVFDMGSHMSTVDVGWGSPTFHKMGREKVLLIDAVLPFGFELLMCDTDMVWLKVTLHCSICLSFRSSLNMYLSNPCYPSFVNAYGLTLLLLVVCKPVGMKGIWNQSTVTTSCGTLLTCSSIFWSVDSIIGRRDGRGFSIFNCETENNKM